MRPHRLIPMFASATLLIAGAVAAPAARPSVAGPPLICSAFEIGGARSLPLEGPAAESARASLVRETLALLGPEMPTIVRMETIRRAVMLSHDKPEVLRALLSELQSRVMDAEAKQKPDALAWFDAGYLVATWWQLDPDAAPEVGLSDGCAAYAWVKKALETGSPPAEMEFAAALVVDPRMHKGTHETYQRHISRAAVGAAKDSLLERNLQRHCEVRDMSLADLKRQAGADRDAAGKR